MNSLITTMSKNIFIIAITLSLAAIVFAQDEAPQRPAPSTEAPFAEGFAESPNDSVIELEPIDWHYGIDFSKPRLLLFIMPHCPFGIQFESILFDSVKILEDTTINLEVHYIVYYSEEKGFFAPHGQAELDEAIEQLIVKHRFPDKFIEYIKCRNAEIHNRNWEKCAEKVGIDVDILHQNLLLDNLFLGREAALTAEYRVNESPTLISIEKVTESSKIGIETMPTEKCVAEE